MWLVLESKGGINGDGDLTWGGEHIVQYTDDVLLNCTPEAFIILLTNVTPINSMKNIGEIIGGMD